MIRPALLACAAVLALGAAGCAPTTTYTGFQAVDVKPTDIKVGEDTRSTVLTKLGSPSTTGAFDQNTWFYISQVSDKYAYDKPQVKARNITAITFDKDEKVTQVKQLTLKDGYQLAYNKRETPTRGRELSVIEQLLGNVGRGILPQDNTDPGQRGPRR